MTPEAMREQAAKVCEKRAEQRFQKNGTTESDTNASYYTGRAADAYAAMDEEDDDCAAAIRDIPIPHAAAQEGDTPRTAAASRYFSLTPSCVGSFVPADVCRQIERVLAAANALADELKDEGEILAEKLNDAAAAFNEQQCMRIAAEQSLDVERQRVVDVTVCLQRIAAYPATRFDELSADSMRELARAALKGKMG